MFTLFTQRLRIVASAAIFLFGSLCAGIEQASAQEQKGQEELTRGPLHEGFGQPIVFDAKPGAVAPKKPPEPIDELPPEVRPEGDNVIWIPGYWFWEDERKDFIWISGFWRTVPPDRVWVPGYWVASGQQYQWVSGFWQSPQQAVEYVPEPPASLENGPVTEPASADQIWVPGCWVYRETRFLWRPGYWIAGNANWMWVPAYYNWTPRGFIFVNGFWDYQPLARGLLFAPVYFDPGYYGRRNFVYTPTVVLSTPFLATVLFARPAYGHYYFGDYYAANYLQVGVYPWFAFHNSRYGYDPFFAYYHWHNRNDPRWTTGQRDFYWKLRQNENERPPQTFTAMRAAATRQKGDTIAPQLALATTLNDVSIQKQTNVTLTKVDEQRRQQFQRSATELRGVTQERAKAEVSQGTKGKDPSAKSTARWELPKQVTQAAPTTKGKGVSAPAVPQMPTESAQPPKVAPKASRNVEDLLKDPEPKAKSKDPIDPKSKDPAPKPKDPTPDPKPKDPTPKPKDPTPDPKPPVAKPKDPTPDPKPPVAKPKDPIPDPKPPLPKVKDPTPEPKAPPLPKVKDPTPEPKAPPLPKVKDPTPEPKAPPPPKVVTPEPKAPPAPKVVIPEPKAPPPAPKVVTPEPKAPPPPPKAPPEPKKKEPDPKSKGKDKDPPPSN